MNQIQKFAVELKYLDCTNFFLQKEQYLNEAKLAVFISCMFVLPYHKSICFLKKLSDSTTNTPCVNQPQRNAADSCKRAKSFFNMFASNKSKKRKKMSL